MLCHKDLMTRRIDGITFCVTYAGAKAFRRRKRLVRFIRVVAPDTAARPELRARGQARGFRHAIFRLARIGGGGDVDIHGPVSVYREGMHGMVTAERQTGNDGHRRIPRHDRAGRQGIAHDSIVDLSVDSATEHADARSTGTATLHGFPKALSYAGFTGARSVLQGDQESARMRRVVAVIATRPCIDVNGAVRRNNQVACMTDAISEYGGAKSVRQLQAAVIARTCVTVCLRTRVSWVLR